MPSFICKCTPSLGHVSLFWSRMTECQNWPVGVGKTLLYLRDRIGGEIAEVRNAIVHEAREYDRLHNPVTDLFWVDDDVLPFQFCLTELWSQRAAIATGTYFMKLDGPAQPLLWPGDFTEGPLVPFTPNKVFPVRYAGMGLTLIKLDVYKRMAKELTLPKDKYGHTQFYKTSSAEDITADVTGNIESGFTEDSWFYNHAALLDYQPLAVTTKHAFGFHCLPLFECSCGFRTNERLLANRHEATEPGHRISEDVTGYPAEQWASWVKGEPIVWHTPDGDVVWD